MSQERRVREQIREIVSVDTFETYACKVDSVDGATCTVKRVMDEKLVKGVRLNGTITENDGLVITPEKDSFVLITNIDNDKWFVSQFSKIEKISLDVKDKIVINGGDNKGMVKIKELSDRLKNLESKFNQHTHPYVNFSAGTGTTSPTTGVSMEFQAGYTSYENDKIQH